MKDLIVYGCGSVGRLIEQIVFDINQRKPEWNMLGFVDDNERMHGKTVADKPIFGGIEALSRFPAASLVIGFANPQRKQQILQRLEEKGWRDNFATLIHPLAWIGRRVEIGEGSILYPGVYIDVDVRLGRHVLLNKNCTVGHDTRIGDFTTAAPGVNLGGQNKVGAGVDFGINCASIHELSIGEWSVIGASAAVIRDVPPGQVYIGVTAKNLKTSRCMKKSNKLIIVGAGGFGREVAWTALEMNHKLSRFEQWHLLGFVDDNPKLESTRILDLPIFGRPEAAEFEGSICFHCAIGDNQRRRIMAERCLALGWHPATLIHPSALIAGNARIGEGSYVGAGSILNPDVLVGRFVLINQKVAVGHDAVLEDWCQLNPGAQINGNCRIGSGASIGSNASLHPGVEVGELATVGSNSQVVRRVVAKTTVTGVPARLLTEKSY